ncbi:beta-propeller fold lactonase family protein [Lachnospiraceae bacterium 62-35]
MKDIVYIGCRTTRERNARGKGLKVCEIGEDGSLRDKQLLKGLENPSYQCMDRKREYLYTIYGDRNEASAFRIGRDGSLENLNTVGHIGKIPVFITVDRTNRFLYTASLQGGCVNVLRRRKDGRIEEEFPVWWPAYLSFILPVSPRLRRQYVQLCIWPPARPNPIGLRQVFCPV